MWKYPLSNRENVCFYLATPETVIERKTRGKHRRRSEQSPQIFLLRNQNQFNEAFLVTKCQQAAAQEHQRMLSNSRQPRLDSLIGVTDPAGLRGLTDAHCSSRRVGMGGGYQPGGQGGKPLSQTEATPRPQKKG